MFVQKILTILLGILVSALVFHAGGPGSIPQLETSLAVDDLDELAAPISRKFKNPRFFSRFIKVV